jgi:hypothetical protein
MSPTHVVFFKKGGLYHENEYSKLNEKELFVILYDKFF